ncbi:5'-nucleotidase C-terminal domain-containing protein [uncultured Tateyamaria sp.]|uniref:bifunctional metallophosphatase/5'-nucleotidase n=1 Tax=uncultured Tateyamaria sp. TaxID=455651 RepID=UPI00260924EB|nr:5'-nucleotidase C-terminal domain-containing protein [uncultured Tateyamaria sp.]
MDLLAGTIQTARMSAKGACVLLDNGDALQGTPVGTICANQPPGFAHPWPDVLNALSYDAVGLGNHDFDFGVPFLERSVAQTDAPTLCANISSGRVVGVTQTALLQRRVTRSDSEVRTLLVGITSVLPPSTAIWNNRYLAGVLEFEAGAAAAQRAVASLQAQGADVIVLLCHSGVGLPDTDDGENFGAFLAQQVEGIDAMVLGHTHQRLPAPDGPQALNGVPVVMPGHAAEVLGQIDLHLGWTDNGWHVAGHDATLRIPQVNDNPVPLITALAAPALAQTKTALDRTLTHCPNGFHTYFGMLKSGPSDALIAKAMTQVIAAQVAGTDLANLPLLASVAPMSMGGLGGPSNYVEVPAGPVRARHIAMLAPFPNAIWAVVLTGADLMCWVERSATFFADDLQGCPRLVNPDAPAFHFDMLHGLEARIDPFAPPGFNPAGQRIDRHARRVRALTHQGEPVDADASFLVAMTSYRGAGGGNFPGLSGAREVLRTDHDLTEALHRTAMQGPPDPELCPSVWRFAPARHQRVVIETSPNAMAHLNEIAAFDPQEIGRNDQGFLELSVLI